MRLDWARRVSIRRDGRIGATLNVRDHRLRLRRRPRGPASMLTVLYGRWSNPLMRSRLDRIQQALLDGRIARVERFLIAPGSTITQWPGRPICSKVSTAVQPPCFSKASR